MRKCTVREAGLGGRGWGDGVGQGGGLEGSRGNVIGGRGALLLMRQARGATEVECKQTPRGRRRGEEGAGVDAACDGARRRSRWRASAVQRRWKRGTARHGTTRMRQDVQRNMVSVWVSRNPITLPPITPTSSVPCIAAAGSARAAPPAQAALAPTSGSGLIRRGEIGAVVVSAAPSLSGLNNGTGTAVARTAAAALAFAFALLGEPLPTSMA